MDKGCPKALLPPLACVSSPRVADCGPALNLICPAKLALELEAAGWGGKSGSWGPAQPGRPGRKGPVPLGVLAGM